MTTYNIKSLRINENMTQKDLADTLEIGLKSLQNYETGKKKVPKTVILSLAYIFHVSPEQIRV